MGKKVRKVCDACCKWANDNMDRSPLTVVETYPRMMRKVLKRFFGMSGKAAGEFTEHACAGNWERFHETRVEHETTAEEYAEMLLGDVLYCSDRWSWDRVIRVQWLYMRLRDRVGRFES